MSQWGKGNIVDGFNVAVKQVEAHHVEGIQWWLGCGVFVHTVL